MLKLCIGDLTSHVHGAGLVIQLNLGLEDVRLGPLLPRRLLLGSCCGAIGCGQRVVVAAAWPFAGHQVFQPLLSFLKERMQSDVCQHSQMQSGAYQRPCTVAIETYAMLIQYSTQ